MKFSKMLDKGAPRMRTEDTDNKLREICEEFLGIYPSWAISLVNIGFCEQVSSFKCQDCAHFIYVYVELFSFFYVLDVQIVYFHHEQEESL